MSVEDPAHMRVTVVILKWNAYKSIDLCSLNVLRIYRKGGLDKGLIT